jgi:hypothetical protein
MKILNLLTIKDKKHPLYFFFIWNFKILKLLAFLSHRDYEQNVGAQDLFMKAQDL